MVIAFYGAKNWLKMEYRPCRSKTLRNIFAKLPQGTSNSSFCEKKIAFSNRRFLPHSLRPFTQVSKFLRESKHKCIDYYKLSRYEAQHFAKFAFIFLGSILTCFIVKCCLFLLAFPNYFFILCIFFSWNKSGVGRIDLKLQKIADN